MLVIDRHGNSLTIGSSIAPQLTLVADGQEHQEQLSNGRTIRTTSSLFGDRFEVNVTGSSGNNFHLVLTPVNSGRGLNVTRSIDSERIQTPITALRAFMTGRRTSPSGTRPVTTRTIATATTTKTITVLTDRLTTTGLTITGTL